MLYGLLHALYVILTVLGCGGVFSSCNWCDHFPSPQCLFAIWKSLKAFNCRSWSSADRHYQCKVVFWLWKARTFIHLIKKLRSQVHVHVDIVFVGHWIKSLIGKEEYRMGRKGIFMQFVAWSKSGVSKHVIRQMCPSSQQRAQHNSPLHIHMYFWSSS